MRLNPFLRRLGFSATDRVVIIHADDVGMCQATIPAIRDVFAAGIVSSASMMVPCSWFPMAAAVAGEIPNGDFGIHLTLTSEWSSYRWRPLSTGDRASGLFDEEGYLPRLRWTLAEQAAPSVVAAEMQAQVDHAQSHGIDITHLDTHMFTCFDARYVESYVALGRSLRVPVLLPRDGLERHNLEPTACALAARLTAEWEAEGNPVFDAVDLMGLSAPSSERVSEAKARIDALPRGALSMLLLHPAVKSPELEAIAPDWEARVADFETFLSEDLRRHIETSGTTVIGYSVLRDEMRHVRRDAHDPESSIKGRDSAACITPSAI
jgi:predicted glycoside hydrolase/deacetylase ChbG (UPF0249 family)